MANKNLKEKAIKVKGNEYVLVSDRIIYFNDTFPNGSITCNLVSEPKDERIVIKATVIPDVTVPTRCFTGYSQAVVGDGYINKTSALENCETSAVGRALGMMGIGVIDSIASLDEINKAETTIKKPVYKKPEQPVTPQATATRYPIAMSKTPYEYVSKVMKDTSISIEAKKQVYDRAVNSNVLSGEQLEEFKKYVE